MGSATLTTDIKQYILITGNYWAFTLTDGALRMLVVLYFYNLGYSPLQIALLFLFYEFFGVVTNLVGGWLGARLGLNTTMNIGLLLQVFALSLLLVPVDMLSVTWVMCAQALSGIAKDLNKMSAKSSVKLLLPEQAHGLLFKWVAILTGSKNTLKGFGFFLGGILLSYFGFQGAVALMAAMLFVIWILSLVLLKKQLGRVSNKPKITQIFAKSRAINYLSAARMFLFGARDVWFVVALPVFLASQFQWSHTMIGGFFALWIIGYGLVQSIAPRIIRGKQKQLPGQKAAFTWAAILAVITAALAINQDLYGAHLETLLIGLIIFGIAFAINSSLHSYLILQYAQRDGVSMDVGFYYMANAMGRLIGTLLSGWVYQQFGFQTCLYVAVAFLSLTMMLSLGLPKTSKLPEQSR